MELEQLQDWLSEILLQLRFNQLLKLCLQAKIFTEKQTKKHTLISSLSEAVETAIETEEEKVAHTFLVCFIESAKEVKESNNQTQDVEESAVALASLQEQYAALQLSFQTATNKLEEEMVRLTNKLTFQGLSEPQVHCSTSNPAT